MIQSYQNFAMILYRKHQFCFHRVITRPVHGPENLGFFGPVHRPGYNPKFKTKFNCNPKFKTKSSNVQVPPASRPASDSHFPVQYMYDFSSKTGPHYEMPKNACFIVTCNLIKIRLNASVSFVIDQLRHHGLHLTWKNASG